MQRRHWIEESSNIEVVEAQFCQFFGIKAVDSEIAMAHAARKSDDYGSVTVPQLAWITRARNLAKSMVGAPKYTKALLNALLKELSNLKQEPESVAEIPDLLLRHGIRFLVIEHLPQTKIDGACFWLDKWSPVVVVSMRYDRIDYFWHTLMHELMHVKKGHGKNVFIVETAIVGADAQADDDKVKDERTVDKLAREYLVDQAQLEDFVLRYAPFFSKTGILRFSKLIGVHPGIIVGQLQHDRVIPYEHFRALLVKVRNIITSTALTDGWGQVITE
jgi:HTH-type transcriptional regulator/antitoxin HigA